MIEQELLMEMRTVKLLLAIDKRDDLEELTSDFSEYQEEILGRLDTYEWRSIPTSEIAEALDAHANTVRRHIAKLEDRNLVEKRGDGGGTEYRLTGLMGCAQLLGLVDVH